MKDINKHGRTAIVLGAGASYCYTTEESSKGIPTQESILKSMSESVKITAKNSLNAPNLGLGFGLVHSFALTEYLRDRFQIKDDIIRENANGVWEILQENGYNLESLYNELEADLESGLIYDLQAIIRQSVLKPTGNRDEKDVCLYHKVLVDKIDPGDYIINFNWDSVMSDALLHWCPFWFPATGFGLPVMPLLHKKSKTHLINSLVELLHIHGSCTLFKHVQENKYIYVGPNSYNEFTGFAALQGDPYFHATSEKKPTRSRIPTAEEYRKNELGWLFIHEQWYKPVFVSPSVRKSEYSDSYHKTMRAKIHTNLPTTEQIIFIGYSFPDADYEFLKEIFVPSIIRDDINILVVNPMNNSTAFQDRVKSVFNNQRNQINFKHNDFKEFVHIL